MKKILSLFCFLGLFLSSSIFASGWVTQGQKYCVYSHDGGKLTLNTKNALRNNRKSCSRKTCNNRRKDYLRSCKSFVHTDCFRTFEKRGKKWKAVSDSVVGFHKGISEGGPNNRHYWSSMIPNVKIKRASRGDWIHMYDKGRRGKCSGKKLGQFQWK